MPVKEVSNGSIDKFRMCHWPHMPKSIELYNLNPWQDRSQKPRDAQRRLRGRFSDHVQNWDVQICKRPQRNRLGKKRMTPPADIANRGQNRRFS
jgi:hypothetical protein